MAFCEVFVKGLVWLWRCVGGWGFMSRLSGYLFVSMGRHVGALVLPFTVPFRSVR